MEIVILGAGYVGLTTAATLAFLGHHVTCVEVDETKLATLRAGGVPLFEPGLAELFRVARDRLSFSTVADAPVGTADVVFIAVGTPPLPDGSPDLRYVRAAATMIGQNLGDGFTVVVNKSTVPIGSGNWVESIVRAAAQRGRKFAVASNPEFLREGAALHDTLFPDRIVVGCDNPAAVERLRELYAPIIAQSFEPPAGVPRPAGFGQVAFVTTSLPSAELMKYAANAFLALKISFINEIGELAERVGADVREVAKGIGLDQRIGPRFLEAGIGWGGSCFGKDTSALVATGREYNLPMSIVQAARDANKRQRERVVEKLLAELKILNGRTIGLLGVAFKPNTDDIRDAPALDLARMLLRRGVNVRVHDPVAMPRARQEHPDVAIEYCESPDDVGRDADAIVLVTEWPQYRTLDWKRLAATMRAGLLLVDARNALDPEAIAAAGLRYLGVGR